MSREMDSRQQINCPICGGDQSRSIMTLKDHLSHQSFELHTCIKCSGLFLKDPPDSERIYSYYENPSGEVMHKPPGLLFSRLQRIQFLRDVGPLMKRLPAGSKILDFGAGDGALCRFLDERGYTVQAVDFYPESEWGNPTIPYRTANLNGDCVAPEDIRCADAVPDAIIMRHVLEHLYGPHKVLKLLHDQGVRFVLIVVPNVDSPFARWFGSNWYYWDPPRHLTFFNQNTLSRLAERSGFKVKEQKRYGIDELVTSYFRMRLLRSGPKSSKHDHDRIVKLFNPKSPLAAISSSLAAFTANTVCWSLLERSETEPIEAEKHRGTG